MISSDDLRLIVLRGAQFLGERADEHLRLVRNTNDSFIVPIEQIRFSNGEGKIKIKDTVRGKDVYIINDVGNYDCTYTMFGRINYMGPDEHYQDIKRVISATKGSARSLSVIMPLLYSSRQHKRKNRESLDCALAMQDLSELGVKRIITFDAHDPSIQNAIPTADFENIYPTDSVLSELIENEKINREDITNFLVVSPDTGAVDRARVYADILGTDVGMFYKRRDLTKLIDGKNPIVAHEYLGKDVENKNIIVVDDMISSGESMLEVAYELKKRNAKNIYLVTTFALFTAGKESFDKAYLDGCITKVYSTNLTHVSEEILNTPWFRQVDCSGYLGELIDCLNKEESISPLLSSKEKTLQKIKEVQDRNF